MMIRNKSQKFRDTMVPASGTIHDAMRSLESSSMQIVLVVSEDEKLVGTLTDGDIRRAILEGSSLACEIGGIVNRSPLVVSKNFSEDEVLNLMQEKRVHQIPVVEDSGVLIGLYCWDEIKKITSIDNVVFIMAGGLGSRLLPLTENCPKPLIKVNGTPMLELIINRAKLEGFRNFIISVNYLGSMIEEYFGDGSRWGIGITYVRENTPLGTAGSLSLIQEELDAPFIVTNGDLLTNVSYRSMLRFHDVHNAVATMAVRQYELQNQFGVVKIDGLQITGFEEKPIYQSYINAGVYVLSPAILKGMDAGVRLDMPELFGHIRNKGLNTIVYPMHEYWLDVGYPADLIRANEGS